MALLKAFSKILKDGADKLVNTAQLLGQDNKKRSEKNLMTSWRRSTATRILSQKLVKTLLAPKEHNPTQEIIIEANNAKHWRASKKWKLQRSLGFLPTRSESGSVVNVCRNHRLSCSCWSATFLHRSRWHPSVQPTCGI
jgi:hypothetical protein